MFTGLLYQMLVPKLFYKSMVQWLGQPLQYFSQSNIEDIYANVFNISSKRHL